MQTQPKAKNEETGKIESTETRERDGVIACYRLIRRGERFAVSVETGSSREEIDCFPAGETDARLCFRLAVDEFVLPGTLGDVWADLHSGRTQKSAART